MKGILKMSISTFRTYAYIRSDDSNDIYHNNSPFRFTVQLNSPLLLRKDSKVGVIEFSYPDDQDLKEELYIQSNICQDSIVGANALPVLRVVYPQGKRHFMFNPTYYIPVRYSEITHLEIYITDRHNNLCTYLNKPLTLTLCFK